MKAGTLTLCLPVVMITAQHNAAALILPPLLDHLKYTVTAIGSLVSVAPVFALASRLPSGLAYRGHRARMLMVLSLLAMALSNFLYVFATRPLHVALVQALNGFAFGAATTIYFAFFVEALPRGENRHHAMGYYAGSLALGHSAGSLAVGYIADRLGYTAAFQFGGLVALLALALILFLAHPAPARTEEGAARGGSTRTVLESLRNLVDPTVAAVVVVALFLNLLHQIGAVFLPLYGLAVGLTLTQIGAIRGFYSLCNAVTRPLIGPVVTRFGYQGLSLVGLPLQAGVMMLVPLFHDFGWLLAVFVLAGFLRAVVLVANTIGMVEDMDESRVPRGIASGIFNAAGDLGLILGPSFGGLVASLTGVALLFFVGPLLAALVFLLSLWGCAFVRPVRRGRRRSG
jgi:predicted MFS family arabinose efflux permease